jgi:hypothetical protein
MMSPLRSLIFLICLFAGIVPAAAETLPIDAFFGRWGGSAIGQSVTTSTMGYGARDLDVTISGTAEGFDITWITVIKPSGVEQDSEGHRTSTASFLRSGPSSFEAKGAQGVGPGKSYSWARIEERSLIVYVFEIDGEGVYDLSRYVRTISDSGIMDLSFTRDRDGATVRRVTGNLLPASE